MKAGARVVLLTLVLAAVAVLLATPKEGLVALPGKINGFTWYRCTLSTYESFPTTEDECKKWGGCKYQGKFALYGDRKFTKDWVSRRNIASVHSADFRAWKNRWVRIVFRNAVIMDVKIIDMCADGDTPSKYDCTANKKKAFRNAFNNQPTGFLLDLEKHTAARLPGFNGLEPAYFRPISARDVNAASLRGSVRY